MLLSDKKVLLVGGKGGVGKTTVSSALAVLAARQGKKVLLVSTDPAHSLADVFDKKIGDKKTVMRENLTALEIDPDHEVKAHIERVSSQMKRFTNPDLFPEIERQMRLTQQSPGAQEAALLERICNVIDEAEKDYDLLIFDTAPTGHTLRLLTLPEAMAAWTQGMLRSQKRSEDFDSVLEHLSPKAGKDINNPMADPQDNASDGMSDRTKAITEQLLTRQRLFQRTRRLLQDSSYTSILFVLTPERLPIQETDRALLSLTAEKLPVGGVVINRILPEQADGSFLAKRRLQEKTYIEDIHKRFKAWRNYSLYLLEEDVQGLDALEAFANNLEQAGFSA
ncbi:UNVERIFIED_ORG: arsenite efflux ATP-binding protein ArsA [Idiomarina abyssalis]|uniref:ArsA family ATPase n=1 Tax=Idiomarina sp. 017G TaxID=2183988 RepID=UPI000E0ED565|nr:ArsA family ATPase [Idiomarina sp. 017G]TDO53472.1 arsenite efflux ATP-binding protein ArsA [Idiomarina sp. 017G]